MGVPRQGHQSLAAESYSSASIPTFASGQSARSVGDVGSIPELGRSPGEGSGYPLQNSCLENSMDRGAWQATVHGATKSWTRLSDLNIHIRVFGVKVWSHQASRELSFIC